MKSIIRDNQSLFVRFGFFQKSHKNPKLSHHVNCSNLSLWHFNPTRYIFKLFSGPWDDINLLSLQVNCVIILWTCNCNEFYDVNLAKTSVTRFAKISINPSTFVTALKLLAICNCLTVIHNSYLFVKCGQVFIFIIVQNSIFFIFI